MDKLGFACEAGKQVAGSVAAGWSFPLHRHLKGCHPRGPFQTGFHQPDVRRCCVATAAMDWQRSAVDSGGRAGHPVIKLALFTEYGVVQPYFLLAGRRLDPGRLWCRMQGDGS